MKFNQFKSVKANVETGDPMFGGMKADEVLSERERHLIGVAVAATKGCADCTGKRLKKALERGIPEDALVAAVDFAAAVNAGFVVTTAVTGHTRHIE